MVDRFVELLLQFGGLLRCFSVVPAYNAGVVLRWGRWHRNVEAGLRWHWPLAESLTQCPIIPTTENTSTQTTQTNYGALTFALAVTWRVSNPRKYLLGVYDGEGAVLDCIAGTAGSVLQDYDGTWDAAARQIRTRANRRGKQWGIYFDTVQFTDLAYAPVVRLIQE